MTKIKSFALKIKGVAERVAHTKSSDPATPQKVGTCTYTLLQREGGGSGCPRPPFI